MGLNKFVKRKVHPFSPAKDLLALIPNTAKVFAVFDLKNGYWQIPLDKKSQLLTTFLTEWVTWCYLRLPMGLICSGDEFCERTDQALTGLIGILKLVDDILVFADTVLELEERIEQLFKRCLEHQITLADDKIQAGEEVQFGGFVVNSYGIKPDPTKIGAIQSYPEPKDLTNLRSFIGLSN